MSTHLPLVEPDAQESPSGSPAPWNCEISSTSQKAGAGRSRVARLASILGGGALAVLGCTRRSLPGLAIAAGGGFLVYQGFSGRRLLGPVHVLATYSINRPVEQVWQAWRDFTNLPRFMAHLESVQVTGPRSSHWTARSPAGETVSWQAEILEERENQYVAWRSVPGSEIENTGSVEFRRAPGDRGTEIHVAVDYRLPRGRAGEAAAALFSGSFQQLVREDVRCFKQWLEAGEVPRTEGQPHGRRSSLGKMLTGVRSGTQPHIVSTPRTA